MWQRGKTLHWHWYAVNCSIWSYIVIIMSALILAHTSCPVSHPYAFANGTQCCSQHWVDGDTQSFILYNSSSSACPSSNSESCASPPCGRNPAGPTYGLWADWGAWAGCTKTCGGGTWIRTRTCTPSPFGGPNTCQSDPQESGPCNQQACPGMKAIHKFLPKVTTRVPIFVAFQLFMVWKCTLKWFH